MSTVGLAMIVRDEQATLPRLAASVAGWVSRWLLVDTGSTDDTVTTAHRCLGRATGRVVSRPWVSFGHNRTELMGLARDLLDTDYLLLLDADMTLQVSVPDPWAGLVADRYMIELPDPVCAYWMPYLVARDHPWRFQGCTHEFLTSDTPFTQQALPGVSITHHADGGSRAGKFTRDRDLLSLAVLEDPSDARSVFYLAQTCRDLGLAEEAVGWYARRVAMGGWGEEVYLSLLNAGDLTTGPARAQWWREALVSRPSRPEAYHRLAVAALGEGRGMDALVLARAGRSLPPSPDVLFVSRWVETVGLPMVEERALAFLARFSG